jgi:hypothetical protein
MPTDKLDAHVERPPDLWRAWEATTEYVVQHTKHNAAICLTWNSHGVDAPWLAQFNWASNMERVNGQPTPGDALLTLWQRIAANYTFFQNSQEARRAPREYQPGDWFSDTERTIFTRLTGLTQQRYPDTPSTLLITHTVMPGGDTQVQAQLICHLEGRTINGSGKTLLKACQDLYPRVVAMVNA